MTIRILAICVFSLFIASSAAASSPSATDAHVPEAVDLVAQAEGGQVSHTRSEEGASALAGALERDHDGSILDNIGGLEEEEDGCGEGEDCAEVEETEEAAVER